VLNETVNTAYEDEEHARGQYDEWDVDVAAADALLCAFLEENAGEDYTDNDDRELESKRGFGQLATQLLDTLRRGWVGGEGNSQSIECLYNGNERAKQRHDPIRRERSAVRDVVKDAAQDMVIREFEQRSQWQVSAEKYNRNRNMVYLRANVDQHLADDVDIEIGGRV
jgi:hypothetical protein